MFLCCVTIPKTYDDYTEPLFYKPTLCATLVLRLRLSVAVTG